MVGRPREATFVVVEATAVSRKRAGRALRRLGFVNLLSGVFWTSGAIRDGRDLGRDVAVVLRRTLRGQPFVAVVLRGRAPLESQSRWITSRGGVS